MSIVDSTPDVTDIAGFIGAAKRRWWLVLLAGLLGAGAAGMFASRQPTEYTSYATVLVNPLGLEPTQALSSESVDLEVEEELASSYVVAADAVSRLDGVTGYVDDADPARGLRRAISVSGRGDRIIELSFTHANPETARSVTDAYTHAYLDSRLELLTASKVEALAAMDERQSQLVLRLGLVTEELTALESSRLAAAAVAEGEPILPADSRETSLHFEQTQLLSRIADLDQERSELESLSSRSGEVLGPPQLPDAPTTPADTQLVVAGGVLGILLGLALIWLLNRSSARIGSPEELLRRAGVPMIGAVQRPDSIRTAASVGATADFAFLATTVLAQAQSLGQHSPFVIAATSVSNGDAAVTTALSLGRAFSSSRRVLVVSADLENDVLGLELGLEGHGGVTAYLGGTPITPHALSDNLAVLPAGRSANAAGLVRSPLLPQLLIELQQRYDVIIVTTPGLGTRPEAAAVTWLAGSVLLCLDPERDTRDRFARAVTLLDELGTPVLGATTVQRGGRRRSGSARDTLVQPPRSLPVIPETWPAPPASASTNQNPGSAHDGDHSGS